MLFYYIKIISNLKWNISFYGNWDNQPPPGFSGSDYGTSSGLSWTYGLNWGAEARLFAAQRFV